jgi:hypothetical protein
MQPFKLTIFLTATIIVEFSWSYGRQSIDQFVLVSGSPFGAHDQILFMDILFYVWWLSS